ncbi:hypothetical protein [Streptomyces sp. NPDC127084]|uniref:hypothetical protein n=1 Tax=Streptomyces sp. NPDC127084 TaxID=3347133 RepID=UPI003663BF4B
MTSTRTALNTGLDDLLAWARQERGADLPARPTDAVLALLALRGADRRAGVPEPTPELLRGVLLEDLPLVLEADADELAAVPGIITALADRVRAAGRLNAKRQARLIAAVDELAPEFAQAMSEPLNLTWSRWYASLLRADGIDTGDAGAVQAWLAELDATPHADRPMLPASLHRADVTTATFATRARLTEALLEAFAHDVEGPSATGPLLPASTALAADRPEDALAGELESLAGELSDRWTAAGLNEALTGRYQHLAPGPEALPHAVLADRFLDDHLDYYGASDVPLPPPAALPQPEEIRALLHAAPLPASLAASDEDVHELAEQCGFPGQGGVVWNAGTPAELVELGADILAAVVERVAADADPDDEYALDAAHILYTLYERGGTPDSVARKAAGHMEWSYDPALEDEPLAVPETAPATYTTPTPAELGELTGVSGLTESDRADLDSLARALADLVDRLAATGCVFRTGDAFGLTPLGSAVVRHTLSVGHVAVPEAHTVLEWDAARCVAAVEAWPPQIAARVLGDWTAARGGEDALWSELLAAVPTSVPSGAFARVLKRLDCAAIPVAPLKAALADPLIGGHVRRVLLARGEEAPEGQVPPTARAALLLGELEAASHGDFMDDIEATRREGTPQSPPRALLDAFDSAAAVWPGGPADLIPVLAAADPDRALTILDDLRTRHPDSAVTDPAAHVLKETRASLDRGDPRRRVKKRKKASRRRA